VPAAARPPLGLPVLGGAALISVAILVVYFPSLGGRFIMDDLLLITENPLIRASDGLSRFWFTTEPIDYWPVTNTSFWLEWRLWGAEPTGYHVTNVILHALNALLIWAILAELLIPGAFLAALLFALHPVNVESVAWIAQRKGLLAMLFSLLSIVCYLRAERRTGHASRDGTTATRWYWTSLMLFLLAMLSKSSVAILPVILLSMVWWQRPLRATDLARTAPFFFVAVVLVAVTAWFQARGMHDQVDNAGVIERVLGAGAVVWFYLYKALMPLRLAFIYPQWDIRPDHVAWWLPLLAGLAVTGVCWRYRKSWSRPLLFAWGFFCVSLVPVMGLSRSTFMEFSLVADHYQYIALIAVVALAAGSWSRWQRRARGPVRGAANALAVAVAMLFAFLTWRQSGLYSDSITLYQASLRSSPDAWMAHNNLGAELFDAGRLSEAMEHDRRALELKPDYAEAHTNLANVLAATKRIPQAIEHYREALRLKPNYVEAHNGLGSALAYTGRIEEGIEHLEKAVRLKPDFAAARQNLEVAHGLQRNAASPP
jgi:tetratricopeptide (TPR) repeat protein